MDSLSLSPSAGKEYAPVSPMMGATAGAASRFRVHSVGAFDNITDPLPERGDTGEIIAKGAWWARNHLAGEEIITPGVIVDCLAGRFWRRCGNWRMGWCQCWVWRWHGGRYGARGGSGRGGRHRGGRLDRCRRDTGGSGLGRFAQRSLGHGCRGRGGNGRCGRSSECPMQEHSPQRRNTTKHPIPHCARCRNVR